MEQETIKNKMMSELKQYNWVDIVFEMINKNKLLKENGKRINSKTTR